MTLGVVIWTQRNRPKHALFRYNLATFLAWIAMDDLVKSFKAYLYDRVSSPLLSSFVVSWTLWNHRLFAVMLSSDLKIKEKFAYADEVLYPTIREVGLRGFMWPLLSALFLIFVYPIPSRWVFEYVRTEQKKLKAVQQRIEDDTPVTQEEARMLKASIREAARTLDKEVSERDATIKSLHAEIELLRREIEGAHLRAAESTHIPEGDKDSIDYSRSALSTGEHMVLRLIAESDGRKESGLKAYFKNNNSFSPLQVKYFLDQLLQKNLIEADYTAHDGPTYHSTAAGRANIMNVNVTVNA